MVDSTKDCEYVMTNTTMLQKHDGASHNRERLRNQWRMCRRTRGKMMKWFSRRYLLPVNPFQSLVPHQLLVPHLKNPQNLLNQRCFISSHWQSIFATNIFYWVETPKSF